MSIWQLAQLNIGRMIAPLGDPAMEAFVAEIDAVYAKADAAPGFVWRPLSDEAGQRPWDDHTLVNLSVWQDLQSLQAYVYHQADHVAIMRQRKRWFLPMRTPHLVLWWVAGGHQPTEIEAAWRLEQLAAHGPTPLAFTAQVPFAPPRRGD